MFKLDLEGLGAKKVALWVVVQGLKEAITCTVKLSHPKVKTCFLCNLICLYYYLKALALIFNTFCDANFHFLFLKREHKNQTENQIGIQHKAGNELAFLIGICSLVTVCSIVVNQSVGHKNNFHPIKQLIESKPPDRLMP